MAASNQPPVEKGSAGVRLAKATTLYTLGIAFTRFANLLLLPLYLSLLSKEEYGALGVLEQLVQVLVMLAMAGGMEALVKIGTDLQDTTDGQVRLVSTMTTWLLITGLAAAVVCALFWPLLGNLLGGVELWPMGVYALSGVAGSAAFQSLSANLQVKGEVKKHTAYSALRMLLNILIAVPLLTLTDMGVNALLVATSISFWLGTLLLVLLPSSGFHFGIDWPLLQRVLRYGVPLLPHMAASVIFQATDKFMLAADASQGLEAVGVYSVGSRIASGVMMVGLGMQRAWLPYFFHEASRGDGNWEGVRRLSFWSMASMAAAVACLGLLAPELVAVIAPTGYASAAGVAAVLCLSALLRTGAQVAASVVLHSTTAAYKIWLASVPAAVINVVLNYLFIPQYGALGAAWSTTVAMGFNLVFTVVLSRRIRRVPFRYNALACLMIVVTTLVIGASSAGLLVRLVLCAVVPMMALGLDWQFAHAKLRAMVS